MSFQPRPPRPSERRIVLAGGVFGTIHRQLIGPAPDLSALRPAAIDPHLLAHAQAEWRQRVTTEFRSIQIMNRFLAEVLEAGDPLDVHAGALELVTDEIRHTELCAAMCAALGVSAPLPDPLPLPEDARVKASPAPERALATAISMLAVSETISVGIVGDLARRCHHPAVKQVLDATLDDEETHQQFGWAYIEKSLRRFPATTLPDWRHLVGLTLRPHREAEARALEGLPPERATLEAWPEPELAELGLMSAQRQALVFRRTWSEVLQPRLARLELVP